jgi:hypothetical protein
MKDWDAYTLVHEPLGIPIKWLELEIKGYINIIASDLVEELKWHI